MMRQPTDSALVGLIFSSFAVGKMPAGCQYSRAVPENSVLYRTYKQKASRFLARNADVIVFRSLPEINAIPAIPIPTLLIKFP